MEIACDAALKNRRYDADGRLHILRTPISKATVNPYYGREIPNSEQLGLQPERVYYMLRDPGELAKAAPSFARNQLMFKHIAVSADDPKQDSIAGTIGSEVSFEAPYLIADLCVWDAEAIAGIETDTVRELSASYRYTADMTPGMYEGQRYDGVMRDIQGNHVALVERGRAGSDVMAADQLPLAFDDWEESNHPRAENGEFGSGRRSKGKKTASREKRAMEILEKKYHEADNEALKASTKKEYKEASERKQDYRNQIRKLKEHGLVSSEIWKLVRDDDQTEEKDMRRGRDESEEERERDEREGGHKANEERDERERRAKDMRRGRDEDEEDREEREEKEAKDRKAKDRKRAKDMTFEDWDREQEEEQGMSDDERKARDAEEDDEDRAKRKEYEKRAEDAEKMCRDSFEGLVEKLEKKGYSKEYATKIAGKVAKEKGDDKAKDRKRARDAEEDEREREKKAEDRMLKAMDEFKAGLRYAEEAKREVRPVVGDVLAQDTAEGIYQFALDQMGVDHKDVTGRAALRALFQAAHSASRPQRPAFDAVSVEDKFAGASRKISVM